MGLMSLLSVGTGAPATRRRRRNFAPSLHPGAESLESRLVLSAVVADVGTAAAVAPAAPIAGNPTFQVTSLSLQNLAFNPTTGVLSATGTVQGLINNQIPFTTNITSLTLQDPPPGQTCPVLHLELGPIHAQLLGLHIDTTQICLNITATQGGGILGDLLCGLAGGTGGIGGLVSNPGALTSATSTILSDALSQAVGRARPGGSDPSVCTGECTVLDLTLGPLNLNLLGLNVQLDNCNNGPVEICVSATASEGILGNLLCSLTGTPQSLQGILGRVNQVI